HLNTDADTLQRFQRESEIMTSIKNPYVVKIIDVQLTAPLPYLVMEYVEGGDLRGLLKTQSCLDVNTVTRLGLQMAEAFKAIHEKDIIHRDIKPENIMYRTLQNGELHFLLTDFGVAKVREQQATLTGHVMMTYEYASPEQFDDPKNISTATDYYSLGVVLYECLTGKPPFQLVDGRMHTLLTEVMTSPPPALSLPGSRFLPPSLHALVFGLLAKKTEKRIQDHQLLQRFLKTADFEAAGFTESLLPEAGLPVVLPKQNERPFTATLPMPVMPAQQLAMNVSRKKATPSFLLPALVIGLVAGIIYFTAIRKTFRAPSNNSSLAGSAQIADSAQTVMHNTASLLTKTGAKKTLAGLSHKARIPAMSEPATSMTEGYFSDSFNDNANNWPLSDYSNANMHVENGKMLIEGLNDDEACVSVQPFKLNDTLDFFVSVDATWINGVTNNAFGMVCGNYRFYISANGNYLIGYYSNNEFHKLTDWKTAASIYQSDSTNNLSIVRNNSQLHFFINANEVDFFEAENEIGNYYGLYVSGKQSVAFDDFTLRGEPLTSAAFHGAGSRP
ncbi:MAG TPA: serine/threonine-protein kinase, partial [Chitinophagaceae bacterium]|nr:serine/threonine-protein kinase [Chitinophagaceae bacterium]